MSFLGEYEITIDAKGRFLLPAAFRKQLSEGAEAEGFVVSRGMEGCISMYTKSGWEAFANKLMKLNEFNANALRMKRVLLSGATLLELDSAGRLLLPKALQEYAGMQKHIVFAAQGNKVELWDKDKYYAYINTYAQDLEGLAGEVLGGDVIDPFA